MLRRRRILAVGLVLLAAAALLWQPGSRWVRAGRLLLALSAEPGTLAAAKSIELIEEQETIAGREGPIRARVYRRADRARGRGLVVAHGVHWKGIDEPRLVPFARELARAGLVVLTPELADLTDYRITARGVGVIDDSARWLSEQRALVAEPRVGVLGFSFAGGLSLVAAADPGLQRRLAYVVSVGGHHDLERVMRFLLSDRIQTPSGELDTRAHEYGLVVLLYGNVDRFAPEADREILQNALREWLHEERGRAFSLLSECTTLECERLGVLLAEQRLKELAPVVEAMLEEHRAELAKLSPNGRLAALDVPVYLLHGAGDSVIPPSELEWASLELGAAEHAALVSPLLEHVEVSKSAGFGHELALLEFMSRML